MLKRKFISCIQFAVFTLILQFTLNISAEVFEQNGYEVSINDIPKWAQKEAIPSAKKISEYEVNEGVRYELANRIRYEDAQNPVFYSQLALTPINHSGLGEASEFKINFSPDFQKLIVHFIEVVRDDEVLNKLKKEDFNLIRREADLEKQMYNGQVTLTVQLRDIRVNDTVNYAYSIVGRNPIFDNKIFGFLDLGWSVPVEKIRAKIYLPNKKIPIKLYKFNASIKPSKTPHGWLYSFENDSAEYIENENSVPYAYNPYPWVQYSEFQSWSAVNDWAIGLFELNEPLSDDIKNLLDEFQQKPTKAEQVLAVVDYVQNNIRYFGIEIGVNSHLPHQPGIVFDRKYGDCKDKTLLLNTLLNELGFSTNPLLVSTQNRDFLDNYLPAPNLFDHVITELNFDNNTYWIDGTMLNQAGDLSQYHSPEYKRGLLVKSNINQLKGMDYRRLNQPMQETQEIFNVINKKGSAHLEVISTYRDYSADYIRSQFAENSYQQLSDNYLNYYSRLYENVEQLEKLRIQDNKKENTFVVKEKYLIESFIYADDDSSGSTVYSFSAGTIREYTELPNKIKRKMPLGLSYPLWIKQNFQINFFEDYELSSPEPFTLNSQYHSFSFTGKAEPGNVQYEFDYKVNRDYVPVSDQAEYFSQLKDINNELYQSRYYTVIDQNNVEELRNKLLEDFGSE